MAQNYDRGLAAPRAHSQPNPAAAAATQTIPNTSPKTIGRRLRVLRGLLQDLSPRQYYRQAELRLDIFTITHRLTVLDRQRKAQEQEGDRTSRLLASLPSRSYDAVYRSGDDGTWRDSLGRQARPPGYVSPSKVSYY